MTNSNWSEGVGRAVATFSVGARFALVPLFIIVCLAVGYGASTLKFAGDYRVFFGADNPDFIANENAQATFGRPDNIAFVVIPDDKNIYTQDTIELIHLITDKSWTLPYVSRVDSLTNFQNTRGEADDLIVEDLVFDPAELTPALIEDVKQAAENEPLINGFVVSRDGEATIVNATVQLPTDVANVSTMAQEVARTIRADVLRQYPGHTIHITGVASLSAAFEEAGVRDSSTLIPAVYAFILVVILVALRSVSAMIGALLVILLATFVGVGVGGLTGVELTPISLAAPTIILTIAVADAIHVISNIRTKMRQGAEKREAIISATTLNFAPIGITSLTTVVGFLTLNFSDSPPFHHLGNMSAAGIAAAWLLSITFLPAILMLLPMKFKKAEEGVSASRGEFVGAVADFVIARPGAVAGSVLGLCAVAIAFIPTMTINDQWSGYFDERLEFRQAIDAADPYFGSDNVEFILDPGEPGAVTEPKFLETVDAFAAWLRSQDQDVAHVFALSDIMKRVNRNLNGDDPAYYAIPDDRTLASQYLLVYELSLPYGLDLNNRVDIDRQSTRITASMKDISTEETKAFIARAEAWWDAYGNGYQLDITGSKVLFAFVAQRNIEAVFEGAIYLIIAIFVILAVTFRSAKVGLVSLVPNALPLLTAFGVWAILVGVVGFSVAAVGAVAVGLIVDYTVHFLAKYFRARKTDGKSVEDAVRYAFDTAGVAIFLTTVILVAGFSILVTSSFKLNADLGLLTAVAVILAMVINFTLLPAMFLLADRRKNAGNAPHLQTQPAK
ncbi:MAG: efflux RND transporter permease subunit [Pseudomonadota bacterium]